MVVSCEVVNRSLSRVTLSHSSISTKNEAQSPFLSALQKMGFDFLHGVENFHQGGEVLFLQVAYNCLHAAKMHFIKLELFLGICIKKCKLQRIPDRICKHQ